MGEQKRKFFDTVEHGPSASDPMSGPYDGEADGMHEAYPSHPHHQAQRPMTVNELLRSERMRNGFELRDVAATLRIRFVYLRAIEDGRYHELPGTAYAVGFIRSYAEYLGLDSEAVVLQFKDEVSGRTGQTEYYFPTPVPEGRVPGGTILLIAVLLAGSIYGGWYYLSRTDRSMADLVPPLPERLLSLISDFSFGSKTPPKVDVVTGDERAMNGQMNGMPGTAPVDTPPPLPVVPLTDSSKPLAPANPDGPNRLIFGGEAGKPVPAAPGDGNAPRTPSMVEAMRLVAQGGSNRPDSSGGGAVPGGLVPLVPNPVSTPPASLVPTPPPASTTDSGMSPSTAALPTAGSVLPSGVQIPASPPIPLPKPALPGSGGASGPPGTAPTPPSPSGPAQGASPPGPNLAPGGVATPGASLPPGMSAASGSMAPGMAALSPGRAARTAQPLDEDEERPLVSNPADDTDPSHGRGLGRISPGPTVASPPVISPPSVATPSGGSSASAPPPPSSSAASQPPAPASSAENNADTRTAGTAGRNSESRIQIRATQDSWVQIRDGNGELLLARVLRPGDVFRVPDKPGLKLRTGNAGGFVVTVDGKDLPPLGSNGQVLRDVALDAKLPPR